MHHILGHRSTRSLMNEDTANLWNDIEPRIYPDPFFTSCQLSSMNKKGWIQKYIETKGTFQVGFIYIIPATAPRSFRSETTFSNYIGIVGAYSKVTKRFVMD